MLKIPPANLLKPVSLHLESIARSDYGFYLLSELLQGWKEKLETDLHFPTT